MVKVTPTRRIYHVLEQQGDSWMYLGEYEAKTKEIACRYRHDSTR